MKQKIKAIIDSASIGNYLLTDYEKNNMADGIIELINSELKPPQNIDSNNCCDWHYCQGWTDCLEMIKTKIK